MWNSDWCRVVVCCVAALAVAVVPIQAETPPAVPDPAPTAGAAEGPAGKPRIEFTSLEHDFGQVPAGDDLKTTFGFKNAGDGVLVIEKVKGG
jgi:hypothetical protein